MCSPRVRQAPLKPGGVRVGVEDPSGPVEAEDQAQPLLLPLCRERTGGKRVPEGDPAQLVAGWWLSVLQCNEHTAIETGRLCETQLHPEKKAGVRCYLHGKVFSLPVSPPQGPLKA